MVQKNSTRRAWLYFILAIILIFNYYRNRSTRDITTLDEFVLMLIGACIAFGFSYLVKALKKDSTDGR